MTPVLVVTGGSRGIGAACVREAVAVGWRVVFSYHSRDDAAASVAAACAGEAIAVQADAGVEADVARLFETAAAVGPVRGLVNNAAVLQPHGKLVDLDPAVLAPMWRTNLTGTILSTQEAIRRISRSRGGDGGVIVNISSRGSVHGAPGAFAAYAASKGAIDTLTHGLAIEVADEGIRVNAVRPGLIDTEIYDGAGIPDQASRVGPTVPLGRAGTPAEVAAAVVWLLSDAASYVTGALLDVGGRASTNGAWPPSNTRRMRSTAGTITAARPVPARQSFGSDAATPCSCARRYRSRRCDVLHLHIRDRAT
ncbi:MAG: hypothetical protein TEF_12680 [Rhizobiales bacterium NRL2]|jgi:NAD(P)-dependent dehydrogenase (short-subunit alcohol dehydrogenase family)|nr:MAG: hypothetical protein TEF_12680 [Rhizobiales bacterium NRL2]